MADIRALPQLDDLYREVVLDHYRKPRGRHPLAAPTACTDGFNPTCGDQVRVAFELDGKRIRDLSVESQGCSISVASGSMMAELLPGKTIEEARGVTAAFKRMMHGAPLDPGQDLGDLDALSGVARYPVRVKCALLAWTTLEESLRSITHSPAGESRTGIAGTDGPTTEERP